MNWLDVVLGGILLISVVAGLMSGIVRVVIGFVGTLAAIVCGIWFHGLAGGWFATWVSSKALSNLLGFLAIFGGILLLTALIEKGASLVLKVTGLTIVDRLLGAGFGLLRGVLITIPIVLVFTAFGAGDRGPDVIRESRIAPYLLVGADWLSAVTPNSLKTEFQKNYAKLREMRDGFIQKKVKEAVDELPKRSF